MRAGPDRASASTAPRSWSPWPRATASPPSPGPTCCATASAAACAPRSWRSATGRWASGGRCARCFPQTREQRCWVPQDRQRARRPAEVRAARGEEGPAGDLQRRGPRRTPSRRSPRSRRPTARSSAQGRREDHRRPGRAAGVLRLPRRALGPPADHEPDRVDVLHGPATGPRSPKAPAARPPASPWCSSSSRPPRTAGGRSTAPTSSPSSAPAPASNAASFIEHTGTLWTRPGTYSPPGANADDPPSTCADGCRRRNRRSEHGVPAAAAHG